MSSIERFVERVNDETAEYGYGLLSDAIELFGELNDFCKSQRFPKEEWEVLKGLVTKLGNHIAEEVKQWIGFALTDVHDQLRQLIHLRESVMDKRLPGWVKKLFQAEADRMFAVLHASSENTAKNLVSLVNSDLESAEACLLNEKLSAYGRLSSVRASLSRIGERLKDIPDHVRHIGLLRVAKGMNPESSVDAILFGFNSRVQAIRELIPDLEAQERYEADHAEEIFAEQRASGN